MALTAGNTVTSSDITSLKTRVNNEMARRKYTNSIASYNKAFTYSAAAGQVCKYEHWNETVGYINLIAATGVSGSRDNPMYAINAASTSLTTFAGKDVNANSQAGSGCTGANCRGLCYTACATDCRGGCKTTCSGCTNNCTGTCRPDCTGSCVDSCAIGCGNNCTVDCGFNCYQSSY